MNERRNRIPQPWLWVLAGAGLVGVLVLVFFVFAVAPSLLIEPLPKGLSAADQLKAQNDVRATLVQALAGLAVAGGLVVTYRTYKQHQDEQKDTRQEQDRTYERELYSKAVEQLGHEKAPVRLGALYSLERLAEDKPERRQIIVDVICAYLRMPFSAAPGIKPEPEGAEAPEVPAAETERRTEGTGDTWQQERQVRLTAQGILAEHLRDDRTRDQRSTEPPSPHFWPDIRLDLVGATLIHFNLDSGAMAEARFSQATFSGATCFRRATFSSVAEFDRATFSGDAQFDRATFSGDAQFDRATFSGKAQFDEATFIGDAQFDEATFIGDVGFNAATFGTVYTPDAPTFSGAARFIAATFNRHADFSAATFKRRAAFMRATFSSDTWFSGARFNGGAEFNEATFSDGAEFRRATFGGSAEFNEATFGDGAAFGEVTFSSVAAFGRAIFSSVAEFDEATFSGVAGFQGVAFRGDAQFGEVAFSSVAEFDRATFSGKAQFAQVAFSSVAEFDEATFSGGAWFGGATWSGEGRLSFDQSRILSPDDEYVWPTGWRLGPDGSGGYTVARADDAGRS